MRCIHGVTVVHCYGLDTITIGLGGKSMLIIRGIRSYALLRLRLISRGRSITLQLDTACVVAPSVASMMRLFAIQISRLTMTKSPWLKGWELFTFRCQA